MFQNQFNEIILWICCHLFSYLIYLTFLNKKKKKWKRNCNISRFKSVAKKTFAEVSRTCSGCACLSTFVSFNLKAFSPLFHFFFAVLAFIFAIINNVHHLPSSLTREHKIVCYIIKGSVVVLPFVFSFLFFAVL